MTWSSVKLGDICSILAGNAWSSTGFNKEGDGLPIIRIQNVEALSENDFVYWNAPYDRRFLIGAGDILLTLSGSFRVSCWSGPEALLNQRIVKLDPTENVCRPWFLHMMQNQIAQIERMGRHALINNVSITDLRAITIRLPSFSEQKRIAAILDEADALRRKRSEALTKLDLWLQSVFLDMFGDPLTNPKNWQRAILSDVIHSASDGPHVSPIYVESGIPFLSTRHVRAGKIVWEDLKYISSEDATIHWKKCKPMRGDLLYTKGGTTGIAKVVDFDEEVAIWVHIALLKTNQSLVLPLWLEYMLNTKYCYDQSQRLTHGIANRDLGLKRMVNIQMYLPPYQLQYAFGRIVERVQKVHRDQAKSQNELNDLFASLQSNAFSPTKQLTSSEVTAIQPCLTLDF